MRRIVLYVLGLLLLFFSSGSMAMAKETVTLTEEEMTYLSEHQEFRIGFVEDYMPFCDVDENGNTTGVIVDLCSNIMMELDANQQITLSYKRYGSFKEMAAAINRGEIDFSFPVIGEQVYLDEMNLDSTVDVITVPFYVAYMGSYTDSTFDVIASNTRPIAKIVDQHPDSEIMSLSSAKACLDAILDGDATCTIMASYRLRELLNDSKYRSIRTMPFSASITYRIGVAKGNDMLCSILNKGLGNVEKAIITDMLYKYIEAGKRYSLMDMVGDNIRTISAIGFLVFIVVVIALTLYLRASASTREKQERTNRELTDALSKVNLLAALLREFEALHVADFDNDTFQTIRFSEGVRSKLYDYEIAPYWEKVEKIIRQFVTPEEQDDLLAFLTPQSMCEKMEKYDTFSYRYTSKQEENQQIYEILFAKSDVDPERHLLVIGSKNIIAEVEEEMRQTRELEHALYEAKRANAAKTEFLSKMSHDIRTPLNGIIGLMQISEMHKDDLEMVNSNRGKARIAANHLLSLINDVLDMNKLEDGNTTLPNEPFNLYDVAVEIVTITNVRASENGINFTYDYGVNLQYKDVFGSPLHLKQILMNLLNNGIKYNKRNGCISLTSTLRSCDEETAVYDFIVKDNGIGISEEYLKVIYEPFTQERSDARSRYQGTGMGMAIVKALVDKMKGSISCESEVGVGTTFTVTIPFKINRNPAPKQEINPKDYSIKGKHILLVEDNELNMEIAQTILEDAGAVVTTAVNGQAAYDTYLENRAGSFDVILMDIMMPIWDGYTATQKIRQADKADAQIIPIIAMTANAFAEDVAKAKAAGMNDHLSKPIEIKSLLQTLAKY